MSFEFTKYQALGNDYLVIESVEKAFSPNEESVKRICDRHYGAGSDGILYGSILNGGWPELRIFNPDGSEAEKSGNGLRIFAHHLFIKGHVDQKEFKIRTVSGLVDVKIENSEASLISINMGKASYSPKDIPIDAEKKWIDKAFKTSLGDINLTALSVGNPHAVFFPEDWNENLIHTLGPEIEKNKLFPRRTNVQMVRVLSKNEIEISIWERGAGYTLASGSSSCAAAYVSNFLKKTKSDIKVKMPGGEIYISILDNGDILMKGNVQHIYDGVYGNLEK
ncbi:diaminopimelate epimerase [Hyphobacterium sp. CCMP332]|nr:diaminopimelate epimerase [Hyphobacterium sp. CCMP332]